MSEPKPIRLPMGDGRAGEIRIIGKLPKHRPYINISDADGETMMLPDREVWRLKRWCDQVLKGRK